MRSLFFILILITSPLAQAGWAMPWSKAAAPKHPRYLCYEGDEENEKLIGSTNMVLGKVIAFQGESSDKCYNFYQVVRGTKKTRVAIFKNTLLCQNYAPIVTTTERILDIEGHTTRTTYFSFQPVTVEPKPGQKGATDVAAITQGYPISSNLVNAHVSTRDNKYLGQVKLSCNKFVFVNDQFYLKERVAL